MIFKERPREPKDEQPTVPKPIVARGIYVRPEDIEQFGYTRGCPRCDHDRTFGPGRTNRAHSQMCRTRITEELSKTPLGQARIAAATERLDRSLYDMTRAQAQGEKEVVTDIPVVEPVVVPSVSADTPPSFLPLHVPADADDVVVGRVVDDVVDRGNDLDINGADRERNVINNDAEGSVFHRVADDNPATKSSAHVDQGVDIDVVHGVERAKPCVAT